MTARRRVTRGVGIPALAVLAAVGLGGCDGSDDVVIVDPGGEAPAAPRDVGVHYYDRAVYVTWELAPGWDEDSFRVYGKRSSDADYFLIAEVTNCSDGLCSYTDVNVRPGQAYHYFVAAVGRDSGIETASASSVEVFVPEPIPPVTPTTVDAVSLDGASYLVWSGESGAEADFSHYRVWLSSSGGTDFLLGETDSRGFLDELAENGVTYRYFVTAVDDQGHESGGSVVAEATPRPDYHNEWVWDYADRPELAGFRFREDESLDPVMAGDDPSRHFRLETDADGWWLVPGPDADVYPEFWETTALKCGPAADAGCTSVEVAPSTGYVHQDLALYPQATYVLRVVGDGGGIHYGALRVTLQGFDQDGDAIMIFDWAYQIQEGNPSLSPVRSGMALGRL